MALTTRPSCKPLPVSPREQGKRLAGGGQRVQTIHHLRPGEPCSCKCGSGLTKDTESGVRAVRALNAQAWARGVEYRQRHP